MRKSKLGLIGGIVIIGAVALWAATQVWVTVSIAAGAAAFGWLDVSGQQLNPALSSIAVAVLAGALALTIAGPVVRRLLGVLIALLGAGIGAIALGILGDPANAAGAQLAEATGISGSAQQGIITGVATTPFIAVSIGAGAVIILLGALVLLLSGGWKSAGRKYTSNEDRAAARPPRGDTDRIGEWDAQNDGLDPSDVEE